MGKIDATVALGAGAGLGIGSSLGNTGGVMLCSAQNQNTWYCQFVQYFNVFKMFLWFLMVVGFIGYMIYLYGGGFGKRSVGRGGGGRR